MLNFMKTTLVPPKHVLYSFVYLENSSNSFNITDSLNFNFFNFTRAVPLCKLFKDKSRESIS